PRPRRRRGRGGLSLCAAPDAGAARTGRRWPRGAIRSSTAGSGLVLGRLRRGASLVRRRLRALRQVVIAPAAADAALDRAVRAVSRIPSRSRFFLGSRRADRRERGSGIRGGVLLPRLPA